MARPQRSRRVCEKPSIERFVPCSSSLPDGEKPGEPVLLTVDEYEVLRLVDLEGLTHSQCATQMNISRTTATEICESARRKVAAAIVNGRELVIEGGSWKLCSGNRKDCFLESCIRPEQASEASGQQSAQV
ncbi:MAG: DUF134 domain-containing protein [Lachnospiraceae bacterium]|jgi:predicted DNA-binding protein (UPF0251 family)|nr:DUF134 domain-containing protein [Lachnospiraceae bacterium]